MADDDLVLPADDVEVLAPCECRHDANGAIDRNGDVLADPGVGELHYTFCAAFGMTRSEEIAWRKERARG